MRIPYSNAYTLATKKTSSSIPSSKRIQDQHGLTKGKLSQFLNSLRLEEIVNSIKTYRELALLNSALVM